MGLNRLYTDVVAMATRVQHVRVSPKAQPQALRGLPLILSPSSVFLSPPLPPRCPFSSLSLYSLPSPLWLLSVPLPSLLLVQDY